MEISRTWWNFLFRSAARYFGERPYYVSFGNRSKPEYFAKTICC